MVGTTLEYVLSPFGSTAVVVKQYVIPSVTTLSVNDMPELGCPRDKTEPVALHQRMLASGSSKERSADTAP